MTASSLTTPKRLALYYYREENRLREVEKMLKKPADDGES